LSIAKEKHSDLDVAIFGPKAHRPKGLPPWMQYRGGLSNAAVAQIYNESLVFVCSSVAEGFALPPAEAMACGCAVASTDCGGIREYAEHEVNALLSPVGDPKRLAANITRLLSDGELRERIALSGIERIRAFTWKRSTELLEAVLQGRTRRNMQTSR
jgi:glycosyltransferase involved in cell wall biosynthesis